MPNAAAKYVLIRTPPYFYRIGLGNICLFFTL
jgi:hypothetical protein